ncbi:MAG: hypothetical protein ACI9YB_003487 [Halioglobus sp.]
MKCSSIFSFFLTDLSGSVVIYATTPLSVDNGKGGRGFYWED